MMNKGHMKNIEMPETFCYLHGFRKHDGKCPRCIWAGESTPNDDLAKSSSMTPAQQTAALAKALGF